jgi:acyl-CoA synthetase (AMP-forming)/AMP-acid ligase II
MIARTVREAAATWGDRTCLVGSNGWELSYAALDRLSDSAAVGLAEAGVSEGDVVALVLPTVPEHVILYAAAAKLGAITAGVNARLTPAERTAVLERLAPSLIVATDDLSDGLAGPMLTIDPATTDTEALEGLRRPGRPAPLEPDPDRPVAIVCTSGTTGVPKGAVFCERQLEAICQIDTGGRWGGGGASLGATSLAHLGPTTKLPGNLRRGGVTHLMDRWRAGDALALTERLRLDTIAGIPTQVALMLRHPDFERTDLSSVRAVIIGGGPSTAALVREARARIGAPLATRYSCTEAGIGLGTNFTDPPEDAEVSVGRPQEGVELALVDPEADDPVPQGEVGEVCLRSAAVMSGYWRDPEATAAAFTPDGFVRTGDLGHLDDQGRLRLVGRARERYVRGGYNVYPMEVETVLADHPGIAEIAVIAVPDEVMGEIGVAFVVPTDPATPPALDELRDFGATRLARHKLPERLRLIDELPRTPMEKLDRRALGRLLGS